MGKAPCCDKAIVKKGPWAPEEDAILKDYIENYGTGNNWIALPHKIGINRCGKSCRLRWLNYLRPNIKHGGFSEEEDNIICSLYISIGSRWSIIAAQLPGRTDNDIKNYWNTKLKKKLLRRGKQSRSNWLSDSSKDMKDENHMETLSSSAIERVQLHMQLQSSRENPNIFNSDNLTMWPCKLNPTQEKMIQNLQFLNESSNPLINAPKNIEIYAPSNNSLPQEYYSSFNNMMINGTENFINESNISDLPTHVPETNDMEQKRLKLQQFWAIQAEIDMFLSNKTANLESADQLQDGEFDYFKNMDSSIDNMAWWSNEFDHRYSNSLISRMV